MNWKKKSDIVRFVHKREVAAVCEDIVQAAEVAKIEAEAWGNLEPSVPLCRLCKVPSGGHHFSQGICPGCEDAKKADPQDPETAFYLALYGASNLPF